MLQSVNRYEFEKEVLKSSQPVLVNFWLDGNDDCRRMRKLMKELELRLENSCKIVEVNWEIQSELAQRYRVFGTPSLLIFSAGEVINRYSGTFDVDELLATSNWCLKAGFEIE